MILSKFPTAVGLLVVMAGTIHAQNLVTNGNFASPNLSGGYSNFNAGSTSITGYTVDSAGTPKTGDGSGGVQLLGPGFANAGYGFGTPTGGAGAQVVQLGQSSPSSPGGISQTITTVVGDTYEFTLDYSARLTGNPTPLALGRITFGNQSELVSSSTEPFVTSAPLTFVATSTSTLIDVTALTTTGVVGSSAANSFLVIDNLVATQIAVPEPSTWLLTGLSFVGLIILGLYRKQRA
jgi:hypothetical protein